MYRNFFSLSELPFSISPDPKYLFMSDRHKEALTHLTYGLGEVGGFALLTGEVGTGKTTISRCLMEQLPNNTQAAFILNPTLSSQELLATLCDQLKIRYRKTDASLKILTDKISEKLLKNHEDDINTLLIIDEAQHLQPEVLEQLRLLTNLETNTKKLLQVILIGQPELQQLLQRRDLRQLAQRITARYHLMPLTKPELSQYISHRLTVADCARTLFNKGAIAKIHQLSQGVPRLTNLLCHSALMLAYNQNDSVVNKKTVIAAANRALGEDLTINKTSKSEHGVLILSTTVSVSAFVGLACFWWGQTQNIVSQPEATIVNVPVQSSIQPVLAATTVKLSESVNTQTPKSHDLNKLSGKVEVKQANIEDPVASLYEIQAIDSPVVVKHTANEVSAKSPQRSKPLNVNQTKTVSAVNTNGDFKFSEIEGVSNDLLVRFQAAVDETKSESFQDSEINDEQQLKVEMTSDKRLSQEVVKPLTQMSPQLQNALPRLQFEQHIYSSDGQGWVNVNGRDRYEGDYIGDNLRVEKILPQQVVLSFQGKTFSIPALTNW